MQFSTLDGNHNLKPINKVQMDISVLITVKNDRDSIPRLMESLRTFSGLFEIVVVDAYSTDGTYEYLEDIREKMGLILSRKAGKRSVGRNECIRLSSGSNLVFLDSDTEVSRNWGEILMRDMGRDIVAGRIIQESVKKWADLSRVPMYFEGTDVTFPSNNLMYSRKVIEKIGTFDENFNTAEDIDLNIRAVKAGFKIFYDEELVVFHRPRLSFSSLMKQSYYDGVGRRLIRKKHGLRSSLNFSNLKKHPFIESSRLVSGIIGYAFGGFE
ncbi:MAG: glycosyltransferase [Thermoplasmatales archaeon]